MKKFLCILIIVLSLLIFTGCNSKDTHNEVSGNISENVFDKKTFLNEIKPNINALYECDMETYGAEIDYNKHFLAGYKSSGDTSILSTLYPSNSNLPEGYIQDPAWANYYLVVNFKTNNDVQKYLEKYMTKDVIKTLFNNDFLEFENNLYLCRGGRGYGALACIKDSAKFIEKENDLYKVKIDYNIFDEYSHSAIITFINNNGWKISNIENL